MDDSKVFRFVMVLDGIYPEEQPYAEEVYLKLWNKMSDVFRDTALCAFWNEAMETYYPDENIGGSEILNSIFDRITKEVADKLSAEYGRLPSGRCIYIREKEPITIDYSHNVAWARGYVK